MVLTLKNSYIRNHHGTINKFKYIISSQRVIVAHNTTHLSVWSVNLILLQI
jgi:hypothetical protein